MGKWLSNQGKLVSLVDIKKLRDLGLILAPM